MATRKTAIAVPEEILREVDQAAKKGGMSRSKFITRALVAELQRRRDREIMRRLDAVHGDPRVRREQLGGAAELERAGTDWSEDGW